MAKHRDPTIRLARRMGKHEDRHAREEVPIAWPALVSQESLFELRKRMAWNDRRNWRWLRLADGTLVLAFQSDVFAQQMDRLEFNDLSICQIPEPPITASVEELS